MEIKTLKIKKLENEADLELLAEGDLVMISVGSGRVNDFNEYHGLALFIGQRFKGMQDEGFDFCRPQANLQECFVGYHINKANITITPEGRISSNDFFTYGTKYPSLVNLI